MARYHYVDVGRDDTDLLAEMHLLGLRTKLSALPTKGIMYGTVGGSLSGSLDRRWDTNESHVTAYTDMRVTVKVAIGTRKIQIVRCWKRIPLSMLKRSASEPEV